MLERHPTTRKAYGAGGGPSDRRGSFKATPIARETLPLWGALALLVVALAAPSGAQELASADVVVVVDTSTSMRQPGMDPERASLLVTKLLADVVPGELAVVRVLDLVADADVLPRKVTDESQPCAEDPTRQCTMVAPATDWTEDTRAKHLGALVRSARGDSAFKRALDGHLAQVAHNSLFGLAFSAARGVLEQRSLAAETPRTVIWLSDGQTEDEDVLRDVVPELTRSGVAIKPIVFGKGKVELVRALGLEPRRVSSPSDLMAAFADAFRAVVGAPYRVDGEVASAPGFDMQPNVDEAWIVVYGDDSLESADLGDPAGGAVAADYAADRWKGAGAYRVAYLRRPAKGGWTVRARGGGPGVAYAVVQRSDLRPALLSPQTAVSGAEVTLVAGVRAGLAGELLTGGQALEGATMTALVQGETVTLRDDGTAGDAAAGDGRFSGPVRFHGNGAVEVGVRLASPLVYRTTQASVEVSGIFRSDGTPAAVDLGRLRAGETSCRTAVLAVERQGEVPLELRPLQSAPDGHELSARVPAGRLTPEGGALPVDAAHAVEICLATGRHAPSSQAANEPFLALRLAGSQEPTQAVTLTLTWTVEALGFWALWGWLVLTVLAILTTLFVVTGYLWPQRFQRSLALTFGPELSDLDDQSPQPVVVWKGVGIGFYRHARAFLHPDFRLSGKSRGALASLHAEKLATRVRSAGPPLYREIDGDWEAVAADGRRARPGEVYRVGEGGPFFRIAVQGGRR